MRRIFGATPHGCGFAALRVTGVDLRIARQGQGESTRDPLHDSELAPNSANGSIRSLAWTVPKPPGNAATVSP